MGWKKFKQLAKVRSVSFCITIARGSMNRAFISKLKIQLEKLYRHRYQCEIWCSSWQRSALYKCLIAFQVHVENTLLHPLLTNTTDVTGLGVEVNNKFVFLKMTYDQTRKFNRNIRFCDYNWSCFWIWPIYRLNLASYCVATSSWSNPGFDTLALSSDKNTHCYIYRE